MSNLFRIRKQTLAFAGAHDDEVFDLIENVFDNAKEEVGEYGCGVCDPNPEILAFVVDWATMDPKRWLHTKGYGLEIVRYAQRAIQVALEQNGE